MRMRTVALMTRMVDVSAARCLMRTHEGEKGGVLDLDVMWTWRRRMRMTPEIVAEIEMGTQLAIVRPGIVHQHHHLAR